MQKQYQEKLEKELDKTKDSTDIEQEWKNIKNSILKDAELIGKINRQPNWEWFDEECRRAIKEKDEARKIFLQKRNEKQ